MNKNDDGTIKRGKRQDIPEEYQIMIPTQVMDDESLSWGAIGVYVYYYTQPIGTDIKKTDADEHGVTVRKLSEWINELVGAGYARFEVDLQGSIRYYIVRPNYETGEWS